MIYQALSEAAERGELILVAGGLCRFHRRRDGVVTIREVIVLPLLRRSGLGRFMVESVRGKHPGATLRCKCPASSPSNLFWAALGWSDRGEAAGLRTWELPG